MWLQFAHQTPEEARPAERSPGAGTASSNWPPRTQEWRWQLGTQLPATSLDFSQDSLNFEPLGNSESLALGAPGASCPPKPASSQP